MKDLDLSNAEGLDESITEDYSNFLLPLLAIRKRKANKKVTGLTGCKKPLVNVGKKKKEYEKCLSDYKAAQQLESSSKSAKSAEASKKEAVKAQLTELSASKSNNSSRESESEPDDKFLGMPKAVGITVTVVGALALIVGGIFLVKKLRK